MSASSTYDGLATLQGPTVTSVGLNITANGAPVVLRQQAQKIWKVPTLQPQLQPHDISLVSTTAGSFDQQQNCRVIIAAIPPSLVSEWYTFWTLSRQNAGWTDKCSSASSLATSQSLQATGHQ
jgi:hypothetical protein